MISTNQIGWTLYIKCKDCRKELLQHCNNKPTVLENIKQCNICNSCGSDNILYFAQRGQLKLSEVKEEMNDNKQI